jgi:hypothetical protein
MSKKRYKITINQSIEASAETEQEAKEYVAENILDLVNWGEVEVTERREER